MKLLDLFCCQGGAGMGYFRAGFDVEGVDIEPQPRFPFKFHQHDAVDFLAHYADDYDCFHASPPCQAHTIANRIHDNEYDCFIENTRNLLDEIGKPYVIENTPLAPLIDPIELSGKTFGLKVIRRRLFESNFEIPEPPKESYPRGCTNSHRGMSTGGEYITVAGHNFIVAEAKEAMGIDWMTQKGLAQAIPPAYTYYIAKYLRRALRK